MQCAVTFGLPTFRLRNGAFACVFGFGAAACQTATTGATDGPRNAGATEVSQGELAPQAPIVVATSSVGATTQGARPPKPGSPSAGIPQDSVAALVPQRLHELTIESDVFGAVPVLVRVPAHISGAQLPVLFVLHGRGEAAKGPTRGVRGFLDDYGLEKVWTWLNGNTKGPLPDASVTRAYREEVAARLQQRVFRGMVVVMPYVPDRFRAQEAFENTRPYAAVLRATADKLKATFPVSRDVSRWGLDGISLGGRVALVCGPVLTDVFGAVGGVQAAIDLREFDALTAPMVASSGNSRPGGKGVVAGQRYVLATSEEDYYRSVLEAFHEHLTQTQVTHVFTLLPGDHSYSFNRGPGLTYLLLTYDALLDP